MLSREEYNNYYEFITNNITKLRQTYKHINEFLSFETIHYLIELLSTWEFDNKWIKNNMSEKIKNEETKEQARQEFYNTLISSISVKKEDLSNNNICGFYSLNTTINYKISKDKTIQKLEGRKIIIDNDKSLEKIIISYFLIYHMLIVEGLIEDVGTTISIDTLKEEFSDEKDLVNLCKICTKNLLIRDINSIEDLEDYSNKKNIPMWFIENTKKYEEKKHYQNQ